MLLLPPHRPGKTYFGLNPLDPARDRFGCEPAEQIKQVAGWPVELFEAGVPGYRHAQRVVHHMATQQTAPIYVSLDVWNEVEDMTEALRKMQQESSHTEESDEEEES